MVPALKFKKFLCTTSTKLIFRATVYSERLYIQSDKYSFTIQIQFEARHVEYVYRFVKEPVIRTKSFDFWYLQNFDQSCNVNNFLY